MNKFEEDNAWQRKMRDSVLVPEFYERFYKGRYELIDANDDRANGGVDTVAAGKRIDEKIVRWPKERGEAYTAFTLEVFSCTVPGRERDGWMQTNNVDILLYCFASEDEQGLDVYVMPFPELQKWFIRMLPLGLWPRWRSSQINETECRVVPIAEVREAIKLKRYQLAKAPENAFTHYCHCGKWGCWGYDVSLREERQGQWYCFEHRPTEYPNPTDGEKDAGATGLSVRGVTESEGSDSWWGAQGDASDADRGRQDKTGGGDRKRRKRKSEAGDLRGARDLFGRSNC